MFLGPCDICHNIIEGKGGGVHITLILQDFIEETTFDPCLTLLTTLKARSHIPTRLLLDLTTRWSETNQLHPNSKGMSHTTTRLLESHYIAFVIIQEFTLRIDI